MGNGIAHVFARSGFDVVLCDVEQRFLDRGLDTIAKNLDREVAKNKITAGDSNARAHHGGRGSVETRRLRSRDRGRNRKICHQV